MEAYRSHSKSPHLAAETLEEAVGLPEERRSPAGTARRRLGWMPFWQRYRRAGLPDYLVRHYWWAYQWGVGMWFFDHRPIINAILFGHYRVLRDAAVERVTKTAGGRILQLACVYGDLTPMLARQLRGDAPGSTPGEGFVVVDVYLPQLRLAERKCSDPRGNRSAFACMNAERLGFAQGSFDTVLVFFLLHEMPPDARTRTLAEVARVLRPGGRLVLVEYGERGRRHVFHRFAPLRAAIEFLEPFLGRFWTERIGSRLGAAAVPFAKRFGKCSERGVFGGFYRVCEYGYEPDGVRGAEH